MVDKDTHKQSQNDDYSETLKSNKVVLHRQAVRKKKQVGNSENTARKRRDQIKKLEARLQRAIERDNNASRKERNGQLFAWGTMVEAIYRTGTAQERNTLRDWAKRVLTDNRHLQHAENGFTRIEDEIASVKGVDSVSE